MNQDRETPNQPTVIVLFGCSNMQNENDKFRNVDSS